MHHVKYKRKNKHNCKYETDIKIEINLHDLHSAEMNSHLISAGSVQMCTFNKHNEEYYHNGFFYTEFVNFRYILWY